MSNIMYNIISVMDKSNDIMFKVGYKIRYERSKLGISQEKLAEMSNLNRNFVGMIERGEANITVKRLERIARALNLDIRELFNFSL